MIFNIVYHTPGTVPSTPEEGEEDSHGDGLSIEVQMAWGGSSTYNFQVQHSYFCAWLGPCSWLAVTQEGGKDHELICVCLVCWRRRLGGSYDVTVE